MGNPARSRWLSRLAKSAFTLVELLVVIAIIGILIALLLPAVQAAREAARRSTCTNCLKQIALAVHNYHDVHKAYPPAVAGYRSGFVYPGCSAWMQSNGFSWRCLILPQLEQTPLYQKMDFRYSIDCAVWVPGDDRRFPRMGDPAATNANSPGYTVIPTFMCPSDPTNRIASGSYFEAPTNYAGIFGDIPNVFSNPPRGVFSKLPVSMANVIDGTSNTAMIGEVYRGKQLYSQGPAGTFTNETGQRCRRWVEETAWCGAATGTSNGTVTIGLPPNATDLTNATVGLQGDWINWADMSGGGGGSTERRPISSLHPGGAQCAYADASVHFIPETVDETVWRNTGSIGAKDTPTFNP